MGMKKRWRYSDIPKGTKDAELRLMRFLCDHVNGLTDEQYRRVKRNLDTLRKLRGRR